MGKKTLLASLRQEQYELNRRRYQLRARYTPDREAEAWFYKRLNAVNSQILEIEERQKALRRGKASR